MKIIISWILMGIFCYSERDTVNTKGEQLLIMIFAPVVFLSVFFDFVRKLIISPAIGKKK